MISKLKLEVGKGDEEGSSSRMKGACECTEAWSSGLAGGESAVIILVLQSLHPSLFHRHVKIKQASKGEAFGPWKALKEVATVFTITVTKYSHCS